MRSEQEGCRPREAVGGKVEGGRRGATRSILLLQAGILRLLRPLLHRRWRWGCRDGDALHGFDRGVAFPEGIQLSYGHLARYREPLRPIMASLEIPLSSSKEWP